ncbi:MAG: hypothetical protein M0P58_10685 [Bacteroidales bacterium]|jgi:hypothetical protein|nr:hypothetical protein [Bacteroidales bacterium]
MKRLSLVNLYKTEIKKNMLAQIKGGGDIKCFCSLNSPYVTLKKQGGPIGDLCLCPDANHPSSTVQATPDLF